MHELGIAAAVLDAVRTEALRRPTARVCRVGLKVGELGGVDRDALTFCFEAITRDTEFDGLVLDIEACPLLHRCPACERTFAVDRFETQCPFCGRVETTCVGGDELELAYLEVDDDGPSAA
ncbi:MAG TPA: hydrogenase maturation nickel metallochaperone HypA [Vicinamibacterales bacterium]|nr:hydrogenase maturation nickel metallochaperone HypA [Vicinamibacterales bacterium]